MAKTVTPATLQKMLRIVRAELRGGPDVEDVTQEAAMLLLSGPYTPEAAARAACKMYRRQQGRRAAPVALSETMSGAADPLERLLRDERLHSVVESLPERQRMVVKSVLGGTSVRETAKHLGITAHAVQRAIRRVERRLRGGESGNGN